MTGAIVPSDDGFGKALRRRLPHGVGSAILAQEHNLRYASTTLLEFVPVQRTTSRIPIGFYVDNVTYVIITVLFAGVVPC
jgi:hypothetical protein